MAALFRLWPGVLRVPSAGGNAVSELTWSALGVDASSAMAGVVAALTEAGVEWELLGVRGHYWVAAAVGACDAEADRSLVLVEREPGDDLLTGRVVGVRVQVCPVAVTAATAARVVELVDQGHRLLNLTVEIQDHDDDQDNPNHAPDDDVADVDEGRARGAW